MSERKQPEPVAVRFGEGRIAVSSSIDGRSMSLGQLATPHPIGEHVTEEGVPIVAMTFDDVRSIDVLISHLERMRRDYNRSPYHYFLQAC